MQVRRTAVFTKLSLGALLALMVVALPGGAQAQEDANKKQAAEPANVAPAANANGTTAHAATTDPNYVIGAQDLLDISVWKEPDLTRQVPVRPDGKISLPLIGEVMASGLTPPKLSSVISEKLKAYISNPEVNVIVEQIKSPVFNIIGQVSKPGPYELTRPTTILDAIGLAGGPAQFAKLKRIYVMRTLPDGTQQKLYFNYKAAIKGQKMEQNILLKAGDILIVP